MDVLVFSLQFGLVFLLKVGEELKLRFNFCGVAVIKSTQKQMRDSNTSLFKFTIMLPIKLSRRRNK